MKRLLLVLCVVAGCEESATTPADKTLRGELSLELRDTLAIEVSPTTGDAARFTLTPSASYGLLEAEASLTADGFVERLPEAHATLYSAVIALDDTPADGLCGGAPATLSLSIHRQGDNAVVAGGISVYCSGDTSAPPVRVLRIFGQL